MGIKEPDENFNISEEEQEIIRESGVFKTFLS